MFCTLVMGDTIHGPFAPTDFSPPKIRPFAPKLGDHSPKKKKKKIIPSAGENEDQKRKKKCFPQIFGFDLPENR